MTGDSASAGTRVVGEAPEDYSAMLETLDVAIDEARKKIESGRVYDPENEKVRIKWLRALAYLMNVRRQIANDRDLEELGRRLDELEEQQESAGQARVRQ